MTWDRWVARHALLFGTTGDADLARLREWAKLLGDDGYTPALMAKASEALLRRPPRFRDTAFAALRAAADAVRAAEAASGAPKGAGASCGLCGGSGRVACPHPRDRGRHCDLTCPCGMPPSPSGHDLHTPRSYREACPNWRAWVAAHYEGMRARCPMLANTARRLEARALGLLSGG